VSIIDVFPTILEIVGVESVAPLQGMSLVDFVVKGNEAGRVAVFGESSNTGGTCFVRTPEWKYIESMNLPLAEVVEGHLLPRVPVDLSGFLDAGERLYGLSEDVQENVNRAELEAAEKAGLVALLNEHHRGNRALAEEIADGGADQRPGEGRAGKLTKEQIEELRALGYLVEESAGDEEPD
jgi:arylsulfatase A-like enzyme